MRLVPVLFPGDLGSTERGQYAPGGERDAPDLVLDLMEDEGLRFARPRHVKVDASERSEAEDAPLKNDGPLAEAVTALAEAVAAVNAEGNFPIVLGGDHTAMCGHVLGHSIRHSAGVGLAVLSDAYLDLATPAPPAFDDASKRKDPAYTVDGDAWNMVLAAALRRLPEDTELGRVMMRSAVVEKQTSVLGVRAPLCAQVKAALKRSDLELWDMERLELDGEAAFRSMLNRHLSAGPIAISLDVTGIDPHLMTAVRRPVSDGIDWSFLKRTLEQCIPHVDRILGLDLCQVDPRRDDVHHSATNRLVETVVPFLSRLARS